MRQLIIAVAASVLALAGCGTGNGFGETNMADMPSVVRQFMATQFPGDGQIHVRSRGTFKIEPNTLFCEMNASIDPEVRKLGILGIGIDGNKLTAAIKGLGQSDYLNGSPRTQPLDGSYCSDNGSNIIYQGSAQLTGSKNAYKLILAVWQGDPTKGGAVWVGGVERMDGRRPDVSEDPPYITGFKGVQSVSIPLDGQDLSPKLIAFWVSKGQS